MISNKKKFFCKENIILMVLVFVLLLIAVVFFAANYFVSFALDSENENGSSYEEMSPEKTRLWESLLPLSSRVQIFSRDGLRLGGFLFSPAHSGNGASLSGSRFVIAVHGYKSSPVSMAFILSHYLEYGWNVLVPEQRAHGSSDGRYIGMGFYEKDDLTGWIDFIIEENPDAEILLHGVSMGAATVMLATGETLPPNVIAAVEDCGYSSLTEEFSAQLAEMFSLPYFPLIPAASFVSKIRAGYYFGDVDCLDAVSRSVIPTLFIHGDKDTFVPFSMVKDLYNEAACEKELLVVPGAEHALSVEVNPDLYWTSVDAFVSKYF